MFYIILTLFNLLIVWIFESCSPIREFSNWKKYEGQNELPYFSNRFDSSKKNIVIIADNAGTEIFDILAPFYLFNATQKANVIIVSENKYPIILRKGVFILPHYSFEEFDKLKIKMDVMIVPNLSAMTNKEHNPVIINWIKKQYADRLKILSVCDGSLTVAETGIYDGKPLTTHASDYNRLKSYYVKPLWTNNTSVTNSNNLYSTAGVSNATEGSLTIINDLFDEKTMIMVKNNIKYPFDSIKQNHKSIPIDFGNKLTIANKVFFKENKRIGIYLENGIDEFMLASILDTYNRTFPKSINTYSFNNKPIKSMYGLVILPTGTINDNNIDEIHYISTKQDSDSLFPKAQAVQYSNLNKAYIIDQCLGRIKSQYGNKFCNVVKLLLDYN